MKEGNSSKKESENFLTYSIPRDAVIKKELNQLLISSKFTPTYRLEGYNGLKASPLAEDKTQQERIINYQSIRKLFEYSSDCVPDMNNGHTIHNPSNPMRCTIERSLMLTLPSGVVAGAVYFRINLATRRCLVANIAVTSQHRKNRLGAFLWYSAVLIAMLHGCKMITGCSLNGQSSPCQLKKFYERLGCEFCEIQNNEDVDNIAVLDLKNSNARKIFLEDFSTLSSYNMEAWIEQLLNKKTEDNQKNETPDNNLPPLKGSFLRDLWGFLKETDPSFNLPHTQFKANSLPFAHYFDLQVKCENKEICYSIEEEKLVKTTQAKL